MARVLQSIDMLKTLFTFPLIAFLSCSSKNSNLTQSWKVDDYYATTYCGISLDSAGEEEKNLIIENLLGLSDSTSIETGFNLYENGEYQLLKNNIVVLYGSWSLQNQNRLLLASNNHHMKLEILSINSDSVVMESKCHYQGIANVHITFKH